MLPYAYQLQNEFLKTSELEAEGIELYFCGILDPTVVQDCTKFPSLITNVLLQLLRDIINGLCYQRYVFIVRIWFFLMCNLGLFESTEWAPIKHGAVWFNCFKSLKNDNCRSCQFF